MIQLVSDKNAAFKNHNMSCLITVLVNYVIGTDGFVFQSAKLMVRLPSSKVKMAKRISFKCALTFGYIPLVDRLIWLIIFFASLFKINRLDNQILRWSLALCCLRAFLLLKKDYDKNLFTLFVCNIVVLCQ